MGTPVKRRGTAARIKRNRDKSSELKRTNPLAFELKRRIDGTIKASKRGKYNASGRYLDGDKWFPSKAEGDRYLQLKELQELGTIGELELQPAFPCRVAGALVCTYRADFKYRILPGQLGTRVLVEDVKGMVTGVYAIKKKLVRALYPGVEIVELKVPKRGDVARFRFLTADQIGVPEKGDRQAHVKVSARKTGRT